MVFALLLLFVPVSLVLAYGVHAPAEWVFVTALIAIAPLAEWIRRATEQLARILGPAIGGLLNVTFGNTAEFVLALFILASGKPGVVKAEITGAIIATGLFGLGLVIVVGCWGRARLRFQRQRAGLLSTLLILSLIALLVPVLFDYAERDRLPPTERVALDQKVSLGVSGVLIFIYFANLIYTLSTRRDVFCIEKEKTRATWSAWTALAALIGATGIAAIEADLVADGLEPTAAQWGLTPFFLGITLLAMVGSIPEYVTAAFFARQKRMTLALSITLGSTIQLALLVAPGLVFVAYCLGYQMDLVFTNPLELIAIAAVAFIVSAIAHDGETNWFEGVLLLSVYAILALAFFYVSP